MMLYQSQKKTTALPASIPETPALPDQDNGTAIVPTNFDEYVDKLETWEQNLLQTAGNTRNTNDITSRIIDSEKTYMVSDGGMINGYGSYGWIIANDEELTEEEAKLKGPKNLCRAFEPKDMECWLHLDTYSMRSR
jgi:hypothetical protein